MSKFREPPIVEMWRIQERATGKFFDPSNTRFFRSRYAQYGWEMKDGSILFVTSEQFDRDSPREYTVRVMDREGRVHTVAGFGDHTTRARAWSVMRYEALKRGYEGMEK